MKSRENGNYFELVGSSSHQGPAQVAQARNMSIGDSLALLRNIQNIRICMGKKPIVSATYENERISIKNSLTFLKCVLRFSCLVHRPIYGRFMGFYVNGFLSSLPSFFFFFVNHRWPKLSV